MEIFIWSKYIVFKGAISLVNCVFLKTKRLYFYFKNIWFLLGIVKTSSLKAVTGKKDNILVSLSNRMGLSKMKDLYNTFFQKFEEMPEG